MAEQKFQLGEHEATINSLDEKEVKQIVDSSLDEKLGKLELPETFDTDEFKKSLLGEITNSLKEQQTQSEEALDKKLGKLLDDRLGKMLKGLATGEVKEKKPGALTRFLSN